MAIKRFFLFLFVSLSLQSINATNSLSNVSGKVIDEQSGKGIPKATVFLFQENGGSISIETNLNGEFNIANVKSGRIGIDIRPPKPYAWDNIEFYQKENGFFKGMKTYYLEPGKNLFFEKKCKIGGSLIVTVVEKETKKPIEGVEIFVKGIHTALYGSCNKTTNILGIYQLESLSHGECEVFLLKEGNRALWWKQFENVHIDFNQISAINVVYNLENKTRINGCLICDLPGFIKKDITIGINRLGVHGQVNCFADENGCFSVLDMEPGKYVISVFDITNKGFLKIILTTIQLFPEQTLNLSFRIDGNLEYLKKEE